MLTWLKEDQSPDARFSMMVDLYHLPHDFPGYGGGMARPTGWEQADALERSLKAAIGDPRFIPYLQVHEFEALVLTDPGRIETLYPARAAELNALCDECRMYQSPEQINHGQHSHPKARIRQRAPEYDENVAGPLLAEDIGLTSTANGLSPLRAVADPPGATGCGRGGELMAGAPLRTIRHGGDGSRTMSRRAPDGRVPQEDIARGAVQPGRVPIIAGSSGRPGRERSGTAMAPSQVRRRTRGRRDADPGRTDGIGRDRAGCPRSVRAAKVKLPSDGAGTGVLRWGGPERNSGASAIVEGEGYLG